MHASDIHITKSRRGRMTRRVTQTQPVRKKGDKVTRDVGKDDHLCHFQKMQLIYTCFILSNDSDHRTLKKFNKTF